MCKILAIVVTYNGIKWIDKCLSSLRQQKGVTVMVIDNGSSDGTVEAIKRDYRDVLVYKSNLNLGFGQANNIGFKYAIKENFDYVFLLNQDAWIVDGNIIDLVNIVEKDNNIGIISPLHLGRGGVDYLFSLYLSPSKCPSFYSDLLLGKTLKSFYKIDFVNAAAWFIPVKVLKQIGGFSPIFYHYGEDNDFVFRLRYRGFEIGITPLMRIYHDRDSSKGVRMSTYKSVLNKRLLILKRCDWSLLFSLREYLLDTIESLLRDIFYLNFKGFIIDLAVTFEVCFMSWNIIYAKYLERTKMGVYLV